MAMLNNQRVFHSISIPPAGKCVKSPANYHREGSLAPGLVEKAMWAA